MVMNATETLTSGKGLRISNAAFNFPLITILLSFCALAVVSNTYTMIPINKDLAEAFHVPEIKAAWASSVFSITYAAGFLVFGPLSERYGKKQVLAAGLAVLAACTFICGLVHSFGLLLSFRAVQGFFTAAFGPVALAYVFEIYPTEKRATTIAMITTGFLTSGIIGQVASSWITRSLGWPYVFFVFAITYLLSFLLAWRILPLTPVQAPDTSLLTILKQTLGLLRRPDLVTCFVITFTLLLSFTGMYASLGQYLVSQLGLRTDQLLGIRSMGILGTLLSPLAGKLIARFGLKKVLTGALFIACGGLLLEWSMSTLALVTAASVIFVAGISLVNPTMINIVGILGGRASGGAVVMYSFILYIGASAGPMFAQLAKFGTVILILAGLLSVSMILSLSIKIPSAYK
jgi:predicted MFS family arabinose efflux permease